MRELTFYGIAPHPVQITIIMQVLIEKFTIKTSLTQENMLDRDDPWTPVFISGL